METPISAVKSNVVQSIRAFTVSGLQKSAQQMGQHFLYANLSLAQTKQDVLELIAAQFNLPSHFGNNFDALYDCITDPIYKSGPQVGFIIVLEHIPTNSRFDKDAREHLFDTFREAAEYWADRKIPFRCFYSFCVARSAEDHEFQMSTLAPVLSSFGCENGENASGGAANSENVAPLPTEEEKMPTDKLVDVSPLALRMSSPFNPGYWLTSV